MPSNKVWWQAIVFCYSWCIKSPKHASLREDIWVDNKIDVLFGRNMDLWLWMGLRGSMKPSSRERLSQNIKLLRIYRFLSERYISFVIRIWLLKIYLGWSVFLWLVFSLCPDEKWQASDGRAGVRALGHHQSPGVSSCLASHWSMAANQALSLVEVTSASCTRHA